MNHTCKKLFIFLAIQLSLANGMSWTGVKENLSNAYKEHPAIGKVAIAAGALTCLVYADLLYWKATKKRPTNKEEVDTLGLQFMAGIVEFDEAPENDAPENLNFFNHGNSSDMCNWKLEKLGSTTTAALEAYQKNWWFNPFPTIVSETGCMSCSNRKFCRSGNGNEMLSFLLRSSQSKCVMRATRFTEGNGNKTIKVAITRDTLLSRILYPKLFATSTKK